MADYSSYVTIQTSKLVPQLTLSQSNANSGGYDPNPPQTIAPGTSVNYQLHDPSGPYGSSGSVQYSGGNMSVEASYACPYWSFNSGNVNAGGSGGFVIDWYAQTSNEGGWSREDVPGQGHPLRMFIAVRASSEPVVPPPFTTD